MSERRGLTEKELNTSYRKGPSFVDWLPWVEFLPGSQTLLLEDGRSVGAVLNCPVGTEGRSDAFLEQVRDTVTDTLGMRLMSTSARRGWCSFSAGMRTTARHGWHHLLLMLRRRSAIPPLPANGSHRWQTIW